MADIVAYLYSLRYFDGAGDPGAGRRRIRESGCLDCHSLGGDGRDSAPDLARSDGADSPADVIAALWNHVLLLSEIRQEGSAPWPYFEDREMADVVAFLQTGR
jgi:mono/diheme cytochrome c family protein